MNSATRLDYNGFSNRATWCANLYLNNDFELYQDAVTLALTSDDIDDFRDSLADYFLSYLSCANRDAKARDILLDIQNVSLIDFDEIASNNFETMKGN